MLKFYNLLLGLLCFVSFISVAGESNLLIFAGNCYKDSEICKKIDYSNTLINKSLSKEIDFDLLVNSKNKRFANEGETDDVFDHVLVVYNKLSRGDVAEDSEIKQIVDLLKKDIDKRQYLISMINEGDYNSDELINSAELSYMKKQVEYLNSLNKQNEKLMLIYNDIGKFFPEVAGSDLEKELNLQSDSINKAYHTIINALELDIHMNYQLIHFFEMLNNEVK